MISLPSRHSAFWPLSLIATISMILLVRNLFAWDAYSVDVLYWDQWDFWKRMFDEDSSPWDMFNHQHGPHKMGLGYFHLALVANLSNWNLRTESLSLILTTLLSSIVFLRVKLRVFKQWNATDILIPLATLSFAHYEIYYIGTNPGLNVLPLLLVATIALCLTLEEGLLKHSALILLGFASTYTGFAIFAGLLVPLYFMANAARLRWVRRKKELAWKNALSGLFSAIGFASFFADYKFQPAVPNFKFPHEPMGEYGTFLTKYWAYFFSLDRVPAATLAIGIATIAILLFLVWKYIGAFRHNDDARSIEINVSVFLILFSIIYSINTAIGRISISAHAGTTSRYLIFLVPFWIGAYFLLLRQRKAVAYPISILVCALILFGDQAFQKSRSGVLAKLAQNKRDWVAAYHETNDIVKANEISGFKVYPFERAYPRQETYIEKMREEKLGFMRD